MADCEIHYIQVVVSSVQAFSETRSAYYAVC